MVTLLAKRSFVHLRAMEILVFPASMPSTRSFGREPDRSRNRSWRHWMVLFFGFLSRVSFSESSCLEAEVGLATPHVSSQPWHGMLRNGAGTRKHPHRLTGRQLLKGWFHAPERVPPMAPGAGSIPHDPQLLKDLCHGLLPPGRCRTLPHVCCSPRRGRTSPGILRRARAPGD